MNVTLRQYLTLVNIKYARVLAQRKVNNPNTFRYIGANSSVLNTLIGHGWVNEILVDVNTMTYVLTVDGYKALAKLSKIKPRGGIRVYEP